ncbi:hypothetical protein AJ85_12220 [Alkalihalobacillus alcalophilus ATCC 27647 = CGMCC 1.3604]|uniref:UPF0344 protein AJ85_12220 n=2 Tax=Alkalihalobacillus alcalophilus ATCC 27647 = CGMCC 1.3604 TaxID=1218173 RepID=A0A4V3X8G3_ALKAL|nr:DUF1516 family protein [Alkalihalobacillus alcalophilus]MED1564330.1 DUF1516 family protein [Alkalihalobacillus alcalophilus]THG90202.1 hypothetical protein AJ85_12220 [Alkalihalobacillus alcalophilus ATCC 27647 = CGMCC 1.3604]
METMFSHLHSSAWAITVLLFIIAFFLIKGGKAKAGKILHMILRLFFVIMLVSGIYLLFALWGFAAMYAVKGLLAIALIGLMEVILTRTKKGTLNNAGVLWGAFIIILIIVPLMGFRVISF